MRNKKRTSNSILPHIAHYPLPLVLFLLIANCSLLFGIDFFLRPKAFMFVPMGEGNESADGTARYNIGGGADAGLEIDIASILPNPLGIGYFTGVEGGVVTNPVLGDVARNLVSYSIGGSLGLYFFPLSRLFTRLDGTVGVYAPVLEGEIGPTSLYWRAGAEVGFRFTPAFLLAANTGWRQYDGDPPGKDPFNTGLYAGLTAQITLQTASGTSRTGAEGVLVQTDAIYPAFFQLYQTNPIGTIVIRNRENAEIRDVRMSFRAVNYTASEFFCGSVATIPRGREAQLPLLADFSPAILRFTDESRILGEVIIRYNFLGQERESVSAVTVVSNNRNTITESDMAEMAAFISPTSPEILEYSKFIVGIARSRRHTGHNQNMQYAIWLFEGLRGSGIRVGETRHLINEAQFPSETLAFGTGSGRDMALLFAASLESIGISSAFIRVGTDFLVAVDLEMNEAAAETMFSSTDRVLNIDGNIWLPIAMSAFNDGFIASWTRGAVSLNQAFERGEEVDFIMVKEAWASYPPAPLSELGGRIVHTVTDNILLEPENVLKEYINQDIMPLLWRVESDIRTNSTAALHNRMGILLVRAGYIAEAKRSYERAAAMGSMAAMNNIASLALIERNYDEAEYWYLRALEIDRENNTALRGLERVEGRRLE